MYISAMFHFSPVFGRLECFSCPCESNSLAAFSCFILFFVLDSLVIFSNAFAFIIICLSGKSFWKIRLHRFPLMPEKKVGKIS